MSNEIKEVTKIWPKTKKCDWCEKRKLIGNGYVLGKMGSQKEWFICNECNSKHGVV